MKSIQNLKDILAQLKSNPEAYNLTTNDLSKIDLALKEIKQLEEQNKKIDTIEKSVSIGAKLAAIVEIIIEIFKNSS